MLVYGFWNNKGGTGKTSLCFQTMCAYAHQHPNERVLALDVCPQANLSELLLGGMTNAGSTNCSPGREPRPELRSAGTSRRVFPRPMFRR